jgi:cation diffusion facilitator family transporter
MSGSLGMQADGFHSLFDGVSNVIGLVGLWWASGPPDAHHPYGHKKFETLAAAGIGGMLLATCFYLVLETYASWGGSHQPTVTGISFVVMLVTMAVNFSVMRWEQRQGRELGSEILIADSYHTRSDLLTSVSVLAGLIAVRIGYPLIDSIVALVVAVVIAWTAITVLREVLSSLTDQVRLDPEAVRTIVMEIPGVFDCHKVRTRGLANHVFVDLSIHVQPDMPVEDAHGIANQVEHSLKKRFTGVEDVVVHLEPEGHS